MARIGGDLLNYLRSLRLNLNELSNCVEFWKIGDLEICYLPKIEGMSPGLSSALTMFVREQDRDIAGIVSPDRRGSGFGMTRFNDDRRLNFTQIEHEADVHFAHKQGFIAKTSASDPERLKQLLAKSQVAV
jgi:hypothetical protein